MYNSIIIYKVVQFLLYKDFYGILIWHIHITTIHKILHLYSMLDGNFLHRQGIFILNDHIKISSGSVKNIPCLQRSVVARLVQKPCSLCLANIMVNIAQL